MASLATATKLCTLTNMQFLKHILMISEYHPDIKFELNNAIPNQGFPAYDIAQKCYQKQWVSPKQRIAISNIYTNILKNKNI